MSIRTEASVIACDGCGTLSPPALDVGEACKQARKDGWKLVAGGLDSCPWCRPAKAAAPSAIDRSIPYGLEVP